MLREIIQVTIGQLRVEQDSFSDFRSYFQLLESFGIGPAWEGCLATNHSFVQIEKQSGITSSLIFIIYVRITKVMMRRVLREITECECDPTNVHTEV
jgi:hypothetical protein